MKKTVNKFLMIFFFAVFAVTATELFRPLWFDEALTIVNFANYESLTEIYRNYLIPNNQIVYTWFVHLWSKLSFFMRYDVFLRLSGVLLSLLTFGVFYWRFKTRLGSKYLTLLTMLFLLLSTPFRIFSVSIRGYQLSMLLLILIVDALFLLAVRFSFWRLVYYFLLSLLCVGTIPTNLLGIGMGVVMVLPLFINPPATRNIAKLLILSIIPFVAMATFYLPIADKFLRVCKLNEGLDSAWNSFMVPELAFLCNSWPLVLIAVAGLVIYLKKSALHPVFFIRGLVFLLPLIPGLLLDKAPFYRIFYPGFILFYLICGFGMKHFYAAKIRTLPLYKKQNYAMLLIVCAILNSYVWRSESVGKFFSRNLTQVTDDDLWSPYYLHDDFSPQRTLKLAMPLVNDSELCFITFDADSRSLWFYLNYGGFAMDKFRIDGPKYKVEQLPPNSILITKADEDLSGLIQRFKLEKRLILLRFTNGFHRVYQVK